MLDCHSKVRSLDDLLRWRADARVAGRTVVVTNGCFDLLHAGHVTYLESARNLGDLLVVGVNSDAAVRALKGEGRPLNPEGDRALVLAGLQSVDAVCVFPSVRADEFLAAVKPDVWVKGGDYTLETLNQDERRVVEAGGGRIAFIPFLAGRSTTGIVRKMLAA